MAFNNSGYSRNCIPAIVVLALLVVFPQGCNEKDVRTLGVGVAPTHGQISKEELRGQLENFGEFFKSTIKQTGNDLNEQLRTKRMEKTTLQMKARMIQGLNAMLEQDDPIVAFIETWAFCVRFRMYLEEGEGSSLYGDAQVIAVDAAKRLEAEIEGIGNSFLKEDAFGTARKNINEFSNANPIRGTFSNVIVYATEVKKGEPNPFLSVVRIPMTPFRAMEGVDRTATAVHQFRDTAERLSDIVRELPESSRWQLLLLLYDLEESEMTKSFLSSFDRFSESSSRLADSVEKLPVQLREQLTLFVEEIDKRQTNLQTSLEQAEKTAAAVTVALEKLDKVANSLDGVAKNVGETVHAWEVAAKATTEALQELTKTKEPPDGVSSFSLKEYREAAAQTSQAASDIKSLVADVNDFTKSRSFEALINHLTWRLIGLILTVFTLALLYRIIVVRLIRPKANKS